MDADTSDWKGGRGPAGPRRGRPRGRQAATRLHPFPTLLPHTPLPDADPAPLPSAPPWQVAEEFASELDGMLSAHLFAPNPPLLADPGHPAPARSVPR